MAKAKWNTVQEYLDCDNPRLTHHASRSGELILSAEERARRSIRASNRFIKKRLLGIRHRPLCEYEQRILRRIEKGMRAYETPEERKHSYWFQPENRQRHQERMRQWAADRRARGLPHGLANRRSRPL